MLPFVLDIFLLLLILAGFFPLLIGMLTLVFWIQRLKLPADTSNRINRIRLWWFALTRPELFTGNFPWLRNDELENMRNHDV